MRRVRDDPLRPDPGFAELYRSLPDAVQLEPWLTWCRRIQEPVLYLGVGAGRLAVPLRRAGVELAGVDAHPDMLRHLRGRLPEVDLYEARIEELSLDRRFELVIAPSNILNTVQRLTAACRHTSRQVAFELMNPHWLAAGPRQAVRIRSMTPERADLEVDYEGGWTQEASVDLVWPEAIEGFLESAGLQLELMRGQEEAELEESPTYYVLSRRP